MTGREKTDQTHFVVLSGPILSPSPPSSSLLLSLFIPRLLSCPFSPPSSPARHFCIKSQRHSRSDTLVANPNGAAPPDASSETLASPIPMAQPYYTLCRCVGREQAAGRRSRCASPGQGRALAMGKRHH